VSGVEDQKRKKGSMLEMRIDSVDWVIESWEGHIERFKS
jgi:hypothetical protein